MRAAWRGPLRCAPLLAALVACNPVTPEDELVNVSDRCIAEGQCAPGFVCVQQVCYLAGGQPCSEDFTPAPCELTEGVCAAAARACVDGTLEVNCSLGTYGPDYERMETRCDGLDNDCDGRVDERDVDDTPCPPPVP